jgi:hypothetical protein
MFMKVGVLHYEQHNHPLTAIRLTVLSHTHTSGVCYITWHTWVNVKSPNTGYVVLYNMYVTISVSIRLYPKLDSWNANKLQLQLQFCFKHSFEFNSLVVTACFYWCGIFLPCQKTDRKELSRP